MGVAEHLTGERGTTQAYGVSHSPWALARHRGDTRSIQTAMDAAGSTGGRGSGPSRVADDPPGARRRARSSPPSEVVGDLLADDAVAFGVPVEIAL